MVNVASATHFLATTYLEPGRAEVEEPLLELDRTPNPLRDDIFAVGLACVDGRVEVPTAPGLGVEPDRVAMKSFCLQETEKTHARNSLSHADQRSARFRQNVH
jgi:D-galactarolactone cycloisomerase